MGGHTYWRIRNDQLLGCIAEVPSHLYEDVTGELDGLLQAAEQAKQLRSQAASAEKRAQDYESLLLRVHDHIGEELKRLGGEESEA